MAEAQSLVSVVVPTYRRPDRLCHALESILAQTYERIEVVVANDNVPGTPEDEQTHERLASYAGEGRVRWVDTGGRAGGGRARNMACRAAEGKYLAFLDDDDEYLPDKIETQLAFIEENDLDMCWQDVYMCAEDGKLIEHRRLDHCADFSTEGLLRAHLLAPISPTSIYMLKKSLFDQTEGFGEVATGQDWWLMLRCIETGARMGYMPEAHVRQCLHSGERLSTGQNKIDGEEARHAYITTYYSRLSKKDVRFIEFRHNAALAFACKRSGRMGDAFKYACKTVITSPGDCVRQGIKFFGKGKQT